MLGEEWALIGFTILAQLAVGAFTVLMIVRSILAQKTTPKTADELTKLGILAVGPVMAVSLLVSLLHLGSPLLAFRAVGNLKTSWLSREILFSGLFFCLWGVSVYLSKKDKGSKSLEWITAATGLLAIFSMAGIYGASIKPAWANVNTFVVFFGTTLLLGSMGAATAVVYAGKEKEISSEALSLLQKLGIMALVTIAIQLIYLPVFFTGLVNGGVAARTSAELLSGTYALPMVLRWILSILGASLLVRVLTKYGTGGKQIPVNLIYLASATVLLGELIGRYVFYASAVSIMVG